MKKIVKALIIFLVVVLSVGGTCFIFFKNYKRKEAESASLASCINNMDKLDLDIVDFDGKFVEIKKTNKNLEDSMFALSAYFIDDEFVIQNDDIISKIKSVNNSIGLASDMIAEYKIKSEFKNSDDKSYFDKELGRNDLFNAMCDYIVEYATLVSMINTDLEYKNINKQADMKFEMIDLYCRVAVNTFSEKETNEVTGISKVKDETNINILNNHFHLSTSYLTGADLTPTNTSYNNMFIRHYSVCDKADFAKNLSTNINSVTEITDQSTSVQFATYYFKKIYGI